MTDWRDSDWRNSDRQDLDPRNLDPRNLEWQSHLPAPAMLLEEWEAAPVPADSEPQGTESLSASLSGMRSPARSTQQSTKPPLGQRASSPGSGNALHPNERHPNERHPNKLQYDSTLKYGNELKYGGMDVAAVRRQGPDVDRTKAWSNSTLSPLQEGQVLGYLREGNTAYYQTMHLGTFLGHSFAIDQLMAGQRWERLLHPDDRVACRLHTRRLTKQIESQRYRTTNQAPQAPTPEHHTPEHHTPEHHTPEHHALEPPTLEPPTLELVCRLRDGWGQWRWLRFRERVLPEILPGALPTQPGTERSATEPAGTERSATEPAGTERSATERSATEPAGTERSPLILGTIEEGAFACRIPHPDYPEPAKSSPSNARTLGPYTAKHSPWEQSILQDSVTGLPGRLHLICQLLQRGIGSKNKQRSNRETETIAPAVVAPTVVAPTALAPTVVAPTALAPTVLAPTVLGIALETDRTLRPHYAPWVCEQMVAQAARRLERCAGIGESLSYLGGDRFAVLLEADQDGQGALALAQRIHRQFQRPFELADEKVVCGVLVGIVPTDSSRDSVESVLQKIEAVLLQTRQEPQGQSALYDPALHQRRQAGMSLEAQLQRALERNELVLHYQPILELGLGSAGETQNQPQPHPRTLGFEALVRWHHPDLGMVAPNDFIPMAEATGLIVPLGEWVLRQACRQLKDWQQRYRPDLWMSVNLSARQLTQLDLVDRVTHILHETHLQGQHLHLELTETACIHDVDWTITQLQALRDRQIHLSVDDFGMGYSSLSYLDTLPVNTLKIDRAFVTRINPSKKQPGILQAIVNLAQTLGLETVAEGVATAEQITVLQQLGCHQAQGSYFAMPLNSQQALHWL
jgi:EAL domain-containing protein (putative c-di-GMP-specific phosphodiesterase class I)